MVQSTLLASVAQGGLRLIFSISYLTSKVDLWGFTTLHYKINEWNKKEPCKNIIEEHAILISDQAIVIYKWLFGETWCMKRNKIENFWKGLNFEFDEDELLEEALDNGFVTRIGENKFLVNNEYDKQKGESNAVNN